MTRHLLCNKCWTLREPKRDPVRLKANAWRPCCYCGTLTNSGIYVHAEAVAMKCNGEGLVHELEGAVPS